MIRSSLFLSRIMPVVPVPLSISRNALSFHPPFNQTPTSIRYKSSKAKRRRRREKDRARTFYENQIRKQKKLKRLHPAAQWKRILSSCDYWFSDGNLVQDEFLRNELKKNGGYCRIKTLLTFPKLKHWVTPRLLIESFTNAGPRFQLKQHATSPTKKNTLVRRRGVTLDSIKILESNPEYFQKDDTGKEERAVARRKQRSLRNYKSDKEIVIVQNPKRLAKLCERLRKSIQQSVEEYKTDDASVLGLDAEYATLDHDIRPRLPAMMQLSAPDGPVGLIWLDKFPNHGRNVLNDGDYAPLASLFADPNIVKVGVGIDQDAKHLASWWGINDKEYVGHFFSRLQDLSHAPELEAFLPDSSDSEAQMTRLADICAVVLERELDKRKARKEEKKKSHWRAPALTDKMELYAAHDVTCAVDIWMKLKGVTKPEPKDADENDENE